MDLCERTLGEVEEEVEGGESRRLVVLGGPIIACVLVEDGGGREWAKKEGNNAEKGVGVSVGVVEVVLDVVEGMEEEGEVVEVGGVRVEEDVEVGGSCQASSESLSSCLTVWKSIPLSSSQSCMASPSSSSSLPASPISLYASSSEDDGE